MSKKVVRVGDLTDHSMPIQGSGSPDIFIAGQKAWRALPAGVGAGLDEASKSVKQIMDKPLFTPPEVLPELPKITVQMTKVAAQAEAAGAVGASATVSTAFAGFTAQATALTATYTAGAAVPGGEPAARTAFTMGFKTGLAQTMSTSVQGIAGSWDMSTCPQPSPAGPHGPGLVIVGCKTVFFNNLPAVVEGHIVQEASGGPATIKMGAGTVFIGDVAPSGGGGNAGGQDDAGLKSQEASRSETPDSASHQETKKPSEAPGPGEMSAAPSSKPPEPVMSPDVCGLAKLPDIGARTILKRYLSRGFNWTSKYDIELQGGILVVTVRIKLNNRMGPKPRGARTTLPPIGPPLAEAERTKYESDIEGKLSGKSFIHRNRCPKGETCRCPDFGCCKIPVRVVVELVESGFHHEIDLFQGAGQARSDRWFRKPLRDNTYAHETGHLLGFYDEYATGAVGPPPRWKVQGGVIMDTGLIVPGEYYWEFRDWLALKLGEDLTVVAYAICRP